MNKRYILLFNFSVILNREVKVFVLSCFLVVSDVEKVENYSYVLVK